MTTFLSQLPAWAQELYTWAVSGFSITTLLSSILVLFKISKARKEDKSMTNTQISLLQMMGNKLADTTQLATNVQKVADNVSTALTCFETALAAQKQSNANLAVFVLECFNRSNLSDEAKTELKLIADKVFYDDNAAVIEALKTAKIEADSAAADSAVKVIELQKELSDTQEKLKHAQENIKANRRV